MAQGVVEQHRHPVFRIHEQSGGEPDEDHQLLLGPSGEGVEGQPVAVELALLHLQGPAHLDLEVLAVDVQALLRQGRDGGRMPLDDSVECSLVSAGEPLDQDLILG